MLHTNESLADQEIIPGVYITADGSKVQELIEQRSEPSLVVANYSGWGPGQLDGELRADSWLTLPATFDHVFWTGEKELWNVVVNQVQAQKLTALVGVRELPAGPESELSWALDCDRIWAATWLGLYPPGSLTSSLPWRSQIGFTSPKAWLDHRMASKTTATSARAINGSKASTAWCSLVSIHTRSLRPRARLSDSWASRRRLPPISTMLLPPSNRAASFTSSDGSCVTEDFGGAGPSRQESVDLPKNEPKPVRILVSRGELVDHWQQELADLPVARRNSFANNLVHDIDQRQPVGVIGGSPLNAVQAISNPVDLRIRQPRRPATRPRGLNAGDEVVPRGRIRQLIGPHKALDVHMVPGGCHLQPLEDLQLIRIVVRTQTLEARP